MTFDLIESGEGLGIKWGGLVKGFVHTRMVSL